VNIFKILSSGDGSIQEPNVSAFLGYLLDPNKEHGLKDYLLRKIIEPLISEDKPLGLLRNGKIVNLTNDSNFKVEVELEKKVPISSGTQDIDIVISIFEKTELIFILCIENKIRASSVTKNQLNKQLEGIQKEFSDKPIGFIYLTPASCPKCLEEYNEFTTTHNDIPATHLLWSSDIYELMVDMLEEESKGKIEPIFEYSKYTIKAFMNFIQTDFHSYVEEKEKMNKDTTKYTFNNKDNLSRAKLALYIIAKYVEIKKCTSIKEITSIFGSNSVVMEKDAKLKDSISSKKSYYTKDEELIQLQSSHDKIAVNSQIWTWDKIVKIFEIAKKLDNNFEEVN